MTSKRQFDAEEFNGYQLPAFNEGKSNRTIEKSQVESRPSKRNKPKKQDTSTSSKFSKLAETYLNGNSHTRTKNSQVYTTLKNDDNRTEQESRVVLKTGKQRRQERRYLKKLEEKSQDVSFSILEPEDSRLVVVKNNDMSSSNVERIYKLIEPNFTTNNSLPTKEECIDTNVSIEFPSIPKPKRKQKERLISDKRAEELQRAKEMLNGKVTIIWIFIISNGHGTENHNRVKAMYKGLMDDDAYLPFFNKAEEMKSFLEIPNAYFKVVSDLKNATAALKYKINRRVTEYYIYNDQGDKGVAQALQFKSETRKVKGIYTDLSRIIDRAEEEIDEELEIYESEHGLESQNKNRKFPSFLKLSGYDKTEATLYRGNLYGAIKLMNEDKAENYKHFLNLVYEKYDPKGPQKDHIKDYQALNHLSNIREISQAAQIVKFYVRESFYYRVVNVMLRTMKTTEEFKPCILPFNETYHSIKIHYQKQFLGNERMIPEMTLYRGTKLKAKDFNALKKGCFIEMLGFMSTSKSKKSAQNFLSTDGYLLVIHVKKRKVAKKHEHYDHGFVDINKHNLAPNGYNEEEQVLFNALNVYQVGAIVQLGSTTVIHLHYGVIFDLLEKEKASLTDDERDVLVNYQYCTRLLSDIEDQGDVYLLASQFEDAKEYYEEKIKNDETNAHNYYKLATVQKECGEIDEAEENAQKSLEIYQDKVDINDKETCLKVFSIHSKNAQISIEKQDYLNADKNLTEAIEMLGDDDLFTKAIKIRERGEIKFKKGEIIQAEQDFEKSEELFHSLEDLGQVRKKKINKNYYLSFLTLLCSDLTMEDLAQNRSEKLEEIEEEHQQILNMRENIDDELNIINKSLQDVAIYVNDKEKYSVCIKKARAYLISIQARKTNDPALKAKLKVAEATIQDYLELAESEKLLYEAIDLIEKGDQFNPAVAQYSTILAKLQKQELEKFIKPTAVKMNEKPTEVLKYSDAKRKEIHGRCLENYKKAINVLVYNNKTHKSPEVLSLKNQIGQLQICESNYTECEKIIKEVKESSTDFQHTEISKASILLAKIAVARGELKNAFENLEEADDALKKAIIKNPKDSKYEKVYQNSDYHLEILLYRCKIYNRQTEHDLSLRCLIGLQDLIMAKMQGYDSHAFLGQLYQEKGDLYFRASKFKEFQNCFSKGLEIREKQCGFYNMLNGVGYCNYSKYLLLTNNMEQADKYLNMAVEIFSSYDRQHPGTWILYFTQGAYKERTKDFEQADMFLRQSLELARKKLDVSHISLKKIKLKQAKSLLRSGKLTESVSQLQELEQELNVDLRQSMKKTELSKEIDDEKITLQRIIYSELEATFEKQPEGISINQAAKYNKKLDLLRSTYLTETPKKK